MHAVAVISLTMEHEHFGCSSLGSSLGWLTLLHLHGTWISHQATFQHEVHFY